MKQKKKDSLKNKAALQKTRKEMRKEKRQQKKIERAKYYERKKPCIAGQYVLKPKEDILNLTVKTETNTTGLRFLVRDKLQQIEEKRKRLKENRRREEEMQRQLQLKKANLQEDKVIKQLEKRLKIHKRKSKTIPKGFIADGLDDILDFCDKQDRSSFIETEKQLQENTEDVEFEDDLHMIAGLEVQSNTETIKQILHTCDDDAENALTSDDDVNDNNNSINDSDNSEKNKESENNGIDVEEIQKRNAIEKERFEHEEFWEDIYGRKRDKHGNVVSSKEKYIPPAAKAAELSAASCQAKMLCRLKKRLKGLFNRLSEDNMYTIANQIDELYMSNSRNSMNEMLVALTMEALVSPVLTPTRLIAQHSMLIAILHANVGMEVGAHFLLNVVRKICATLKACPSIDNKELDNLILMLSHFYYFKLCGHKLLYEIINLLLERFTEKEIELILLILKNVGFLLRKDNPSALKELILKLQQKAATTNSDSSRLKFMLDILLAIKNNNINKIPQYDPSYVEHLKKILRNFVRKGNTVTQFDISLVDLLEADERGKWWVVGSAWTRSGDLGKPSKSRENIDKSIFGDKLLELARKQRMNTDIRRNIFCVLMTAEDYLDAFEKLHHLGLRRQQDREIIYVIIACCLQENKFNLYYALLAQRFCEYDRRYQMTIQYTLWDKLKTLGSCTSQQLVNLARLLTHLFVQGALSFSILKVIHFTELDKPTVKLIRQIMLGILLHNDEEACLNVFQRISLSSQLQNFRESLRLFINHFLLKNIDSCTARGQTERILLRKRAELVDKVLLSCTSKMIF